MHDTQNYLDIGKIKAAAQAVINAATVSDGFNSVAKYMEAVSPVETLALIETLEKVTAEHSRAVKTLQKAGYTDHGGELWKPPLGPSPDLLLKRIDALTVERDTARQQAATLRAALVAVFGTDDLIALEVLRANYQHSGATKTAKVIAAIDALIATHPDNNPENKA